MTTYDQVAEFHRTFGHPVAERPTSHLSQELFDLRIELIDEEFTELKEAVEARNLIGIADALADLDYVIAGFALCCGIPHDDVVAEVHRSNMSKLGTDGNPIYREDGKVLKGPNYSPPAIAGILVSPRGKASHNTEEN